MPPILSWLAFLLVLLSCCGRGCFGHNSHVALNIRDGEFVSLHVGAPGTDVVFWLRWDSDYISVMHETELGRASRTVTLDPAPPSEILCFGRRCQRLPIVWGRNKAELLSMNANSRHPQLFPVAITNYRGVLGLGPQSPVWRIFRYYSYDSRTLVLSNEPLGALIGASAAAVTTQGLLGQNFVPLAINGVRQWAQLRLDIDYTFMPYSLAASASTPTWRLELPAGAGGRRTNVLRIDRAHFVAAGSDGFAVSLVRPIGQPYVPSS